MHHITTPGQGSPGTGRLVARRPLGPLTKLGPLTNTSYGTKTRKAFLLHHLTMLSTYIHIYMAYAYVYRETYIHTQINNTCLSEYQHTYRHKQRCIHKHAYILLYIHT